MSKTTLYVVQGLKENESGDLIKDEPIEFQSPGDAQRRAQALAASGAGVVVWQHVGDPETGVWEEPRVVFRAGRFGDA
jgi:hypothetical protein